MEPIDIQVRALVNDAVRNLDLVNRKVDDQEREIHKLAQAQHDLERSALSLSDAQKALAKNTDPAKQHELEGAVLDARVALDNQQKEVDELARSYMGFSQQTEATKLSITDVKSAVDLAGQGLEKLKQIYDATIAKAAEWGDQMGDLAQLTGSSVEETSRLAVVWQEAGNDVDDLGRVLKAMNKEGLNLNLKTLLDLNRQYNAIQDPIARTTFLYKNFGKSAEDVAEIMGRTPEELQKLADAADRSGKVIDEAFAKRAETWNTQLAILSQQAEGAGIQIGGTLMNGTLDFLNAVEDATAGTLDWVRGIPLIGGALGGIRDTVSDSIHAFDEQRTKVDDASTAISGATGYIDAYSRSSAIAATEIVKVRDAQEEANQALSDLNTIIGGKLGPEQEKYYQTQKDLGSQAQELKDQIDALKVTDGQYYQQVKSNGMTAAEVALANEKLAKAQRELAETSDPYKIAQLNVEIEKQQKELAGASEVVSGYVDNSKKIDELQGKYDEITGKIEENRKAHEEATARIVFGFIMQKAAAEGFKNLSITELGEIGKAWGIYDETTAKALAAVDTAVSTHGATAQSVINALGGAINGLPTEKTFTYKIKTEGSAPGLAFGSEDFGDGKETDVTPIIPSTNDNTTLTGPQAGFAQGGSFTVPGSGSGDRPFLVQLTPGERVDVTPNGKRSSGEGTMIKVEAGAIVINGEGKSARAIAEEALTQLAAKARALSAAGRQYSRG